MAHSRLACPQLHMYIAELRVVEARVYHGNADNYIIIITSFLYNVNI
jgi:hypothetical protein